jgi:serine/threonine-protein kinase
MIGQQVENYRILAPLGVGGMGEVWKAIDVNLERIVALKVITVGLSTNADLIARFRLEARVQAALNHPNIATLYSFVVWDGKAVMVMEYVEGETLRDMIVSRGAIPTQSAVNLCRQALLGVEAAHRQGVVHRDLKSANLMLNKAGVVKVMDFGIAKIQDGARLTRTNTAIGTFCYMAPEQIRGLEVDARSDIYSMGVTLYEMLTGRVPFDFQSDFEIQSAHVHTPPTPPMVHNPNIPAAVEAVVMRALAKKPDDRFASAGEFIRALPDLNLAAPMHVGPIASARSTVLESPALSLGRESSTGRKTECLAETSTGTFQPPPQWPQLNNPPVAPSPQMPMTGFNPAGEAQAVPSEGKRGNKLGVIVGAACVVFIGAILAVGWLLLGPKHSTRTDEGGRATGSTSTDKPDAMETADTHGPTPGSESPHHPVIGPAGNPSGTHGITRGSVNSNQKNAPPVKPEIREQKSGSAKSPVAVNPPVQPPPISPSAMPQPAQGGLLSGRWEGNFVDTQRQEATSVKLLLNVAGQDSAGVSSISGTMTYTAADLSPGTCLVRGSDYDSRRRQLKLAFTGCTKKAGSSVPAIFNSFTLFNDVNPTSTLLQQGTVFGQPALATLYRKQ